VHKPFKTAFVQATGHSPYPYQIRLACGQCGPENDWLASGTPCQSRLIDIPTGLGKTAAVVMAWLWNRETFRDGTGPHNSRATQTS